MRHSHKVVAGAAAAALALGLGAGATAALPAAYAEAAAASTTQSIDTLEGLDLGSGAHVQSTVAINQVGVREEALAAVKKWRQDALDTNVRWMVNGEEKTVAEALTAAGISRDQYLNPQWSYAMERIAVQRAAETLSFELGHTRPNLTEWNSLSYNTKHSSTEVLAWGNSNVTGAINNWASEKKDWVEKTGGVTGHYTMLIDPAFASYGFGGANAWRWAGAATQERSGSQDATNWSGDLAFTLPMDAHHFNSADLPSSVTLSVGQAKPIEMTQTYPGGRWDKDTQLTYLLALTSDNPSVLRTDGTQIVGVAPGTATLTVTSGDQSRTVKVTVVAASITDLKNPTDVTVPSGASVEDLKGNLPTSVEASYDNNTTGNVPVTWADLSEADQKTLKARDSGTITLVGTVEGTDKTATVTVKVTAATPKSAALKDADKTVTTPSGTNPTLPKKATVTWSNGDTSTEPVTWPALTDAQKKIVASRDGGTFEITGTAQGQPVQVTVTVTPATVKAVAPIDPATTEAKHAPKLATTAQVTWSNGDVTDEAIVWNVTAADYAKRTDAPKQVTGTILAGTANKQPVTTTLTVTAKIVKVADGGTVTTPSGTDPAAQLPKTVQATWSDDVVTRPAVTWDASKKADYSKRDGGQYQLTGTVVGTDLKATITVNVEAANVTGVTVTPDKITVSKGAKLPSLPGTVDVAYSNGETVKTPVTWDTHAVNTDAIGSYPATATVEKQPVSITVEVVAAQVTSVDQPKGVTVPSGTAEDKLALPGTATAHWDNGTTSETPITWNTLTKDQQATLASRAGGTFEVKGTAEGKPVTVTVTVTPATATSATLADTDKTVTTPSGTAPTLAEKATVTWSNGESSQETITWDTIAKDVYSARAGGTFQTQGTVAGLTVSTDVTVTPATPRKVKTDTIEVTTQVGTAPTLPETLPVIWSNGDETDEPVTWDEVTAEQYAKAGTFEVAGTVNVADTAVPATAGGAAVTPSLRVALRAAKAGEPVGKTFPVTAKVTVTNQPVTPVEEPAQPADGTKSATDKADKGIKATVRTLARTGGSLLILPLAAGLVAAGAILVRRRQA